jgi:hypothetical protein
VLPRIDINRMLPMADPRELDDGACYLTVAAHSALIDAGITVSGQQRDRAGLIVGTTSVSARASAAFKQSVDQRGLRHPSTNAFAHLVLNAAAGATSKLLSLRGPTSTVSTGVDSGLIAIVYAAMLLAARAELDLCVAGGLDALNGDETGTHADGAACVVLGRTGLGRSPQVELAGWGLGGPEQIDTAVERALARAGEAASSVDIVIGRNRRSARVANDGGFESRVHQAIAGYGDAARSAYACAAGVLAIRRGYARLVAVLADEGLSASGALLLRAIR